MKTVKGVCALYDTAMIICKGCKNGQGDALYDTVMVICEGGALYDTAKIIIM